MIIYLNQIQYKSQEEETKYTFFFLQSLTPNVPNVSVLFDLLLNTCTLIHVIR